MPELANILSECDKDHKCCRTFNPNEWRPTYEAGMKEGAEFLKEKGLTESQFLSLNKKCCRLFSDDSFQGTFQAASLETVRRECVFLSSIEIEEFERLFVIQKPTTVGIDW